MARGTRLGHWPFFALGVVGWVIATSLIPPNFSGGDVGLFRDPGANLVLYHRFEASGLMYTGDLQSRLFAHYTPLVPLSYAPFVWFFGLGPRVGTFYFLLLNVAIVALTFYLLDRSGIRSRLVFWIRVMLVVLMPVMLSEPDRPEAAAIVLLMLTAIASFCERRGWWAVCGAAVAATFLAHPYAGMLAAFWVAWVYGLRARLGQIQWRQAATRLGAAGGVAVVLISAVAGVFYWLDPTSLPRFMGHAFGARSGLGILKAEPSGVGASGQMGRYWTLLRHTITPHNPLYFTALGLLVLAGMIGWRFVLTRRGRAPVEHWVAGGSLLMLVSAPVLFPNQGQYLAVPAFFAGIATLLTAKTVGSQELARRACLYLAIVLLSRVPMWFYYLLPRVESESSYAQALRQPERLLDRLPSRDATVALLGGDYDLFKSSMPHLVEMRDFVSGEDFRQVQGIAFCPTAAEDLSDSAFENWDLLDRSQFELVERAPLRSRLSLLGHPVGQSYWGWGCNLYVRRGTRGPGK